MVSNLPVNLKLSATDRVSRVLGNVGNKLDALGKKARSTSNRFHLLKMRTEKFSNSMSKIGGGISRAGRAMGTRLSAPLAGIGILALKTAATFEKSMNLVEAKTGATGSELEKLKNLAKDLGSRTQFSASQAAGGMAFLAQAGFKVNEILSATPSMLSLAASSQIDLAQAADIASNIMGAFNIKAEQTGRVADVLAAITASTNVDMIQLSETMKFAGPVAAQFGASLEDTAAAAGLLGNVGIQGTNAGTALKNAFLAFSAPASQARKLLDAVGISVASPTGKMRRFGDILTDLSGKLGKMPQQARLQVLEALFGKIGIAGAASLAKAAERGDLLKLQKNMENVTGTADRMAQIMNKGASGGVVKLMSALEGLAIKLGDTGILNDLTNMIEKLTDWVSKLSAADRKTMLWAAKFSALAIAISPILIALGSLVSLIGALAPAIAFLGSILSGPTLAAIAAVGAGLAGLWKIFEFGKMVFVDFKDDMIMTLTSLIKTFTSMFVPFGDEIISFFENIGPLASKIGKFIGFKTLAPEAPKSNNFAAKERPIPFGFKREFSAIPSGKSSANVTVDFKNMPRGVNVREKVSQGMNFNLNRGFQGAH